MKLRGGVTADYEEVRRLSERLARLLGKSGQVRLTTPEGTDLTLSVRDREIFPFYANVREPGACAALPDGEAAVSPVQGTAEGVLVNPFAIEKHEIGFPREPMRLEVRQGTVVGISGGVEAEFLAQVLDGAGATARNIAEFALGTNPACRLGASLREAKKAWGTAHIGIGDDRSLGGSVESPLHIDLIFRNPTVTADGVLLVEDGRIVAWEGDQAR